jgi:hypothetical protein
MQLTRKSTGENEGIDGNIKISLQNGELKITVNNKISKGIASGTGQGTRFIRQMTENLDIGYVFSKSEDDSEFISTITVNLDKANQFEATPTQ